MKFVFEFSLHVVDKTISFCFFKSLNLPGPPPHFYKRAGMSWNELELNTNVLLTCSSVIRYLLVQPNEKEEVEKGIGCWSRWLVRVASWLVSEEKDDVLANFSKEKN